MRRRQEAVDAVATVANGMDSAQARAALTAAMTAQGEVVSDADPDHYTDFITAMHRKDGGVSYLSTLLGSYKQLGHELRQAARKR